MLVDFHVHSSASDGSFDSQSIIAESKRKGIEIVAITDHDTIEGIRYFPIFSEKIVVLPGVEISAEFTGTLHILGYAVDPEHQKLVSTLNEIQRFRKERNLRILQKMNRMGFSVSLEELVQIAGNETIGRPHFARLMVCKGWVSSTREAFERYLKKGGLLYEDKKRLSPREAIELIREANGIPVLAHPYQTGLSGEKLEELVARLIGWGLEGIEVFYPQHTEAMIKEYLYLAQKYDLLVTAGSDFHGDNKPGTPLGMEVPYLYLHRFLNQVWGRYENGETDSYSR